MTGASGRSTSWRRRASGVALAAGWIAMIVLVAVGADLLMPWEPEAMDLRNRLAPPVWASGDWAHPFGTDDIGRDLLSRTISAIRVSLLVALAGTMIGALLGTLAGFVAAHFRGRIDDLVMLAVDFQAAVPVLILTLMVLALFPNTLLVFVAVVGIHGWDRYARLTRGLTMSAQGHGYAVALRLIGASPWRVYAMHVLPNISGALIVNMTLNFPEVVLLETSLSFLGLGIQPPTTSLGNLVSLGRDHLLSAWWVAAIPAAIILLTTLAFSLLGDWLRDRLDPTLRGL
ncbi:ABC transporter permease [Stella sp.]|uniref:ABC transporter permease n=1 Tax=Stella sp. TaxID=2912054 RepID=UPI0035AF379E